MEKRKKGYKKKVFGLAVCILLGAAGQDWMLSKQIYAAQKGTSIEEAYLEGKEPHFTEGFLEAQENGKEENSTNIQLYARSAVLMDADSGRVLFGKNENTDCQSKNFFLIPFFPFFHSTTRFCFILSSKIYALGQLLLTNSRSQGWKSRKYEG